MAAQNSSVWALIDGDFQLYEYFEILKAFFQNFFLPEIGEPSVVGNGGKTRLNHCLNGWFFSRIKFGNEPFVGLAKSTNGSA